MSLSKKTIKLKESSNLQKYVDLARAETKKSFMPINTSMPGIVLEIYRIMKTIQMSTFLKSARKLKKVLD